MQLIDTLAALGATPADLRAIPIELTAYINRRADRAPLPALITDGQKAENAENLAESLVDLADARALRELAKAKRAEAAIDLDIAAAAEAEADRLQGER